MKYIVFTYNDLPTINIGDYIQSLAAQQYMGSDIVYVNRDELGEYDEEEAKVIMNGWYTYKPHTCLPNAHTIPLFVAFHLNAEIEKAFFTPSNISILQKYAPIGCRDVHTMSVLKRRGIDAYFSGCLTTTIGYSYRFKKIPINNDIFIVDPYSYLPNGKNIFEFLKTFYQLLRNFRSILRLIDKYKQDNPFTINLSKVGIGRIFLVTKAYILLKKICDDDVIWNARYITQWYMNNEYPTDGLRFHRANELLRLYSGAKYIITSRIHCAFPCLGLQTPVAFVKSDAGGEKSVCRLEHISELLNVVELSGENLKSNFLQHKFSLNTSFANKLNYQDCQKKLIRECVDFITMK